MGYMGLAQEHNREAISFVFSLPIAAAVAAAAVVAVVAVAAVVVVSAVVVSAVVVSAAVSASVSVSVSLPVLPSSGTDSGVQSPPYSSSTSNRQFRASTNESDANFPLISSGRFPPRVEVSVHCPATSTAALHTFETKQESSASEHLPSQRDREAGR
jgi:hypothetical protein